MKLRAVLRSVHLHVLTWPTFEKNIHLFTSRGRRIMRLLQVPWLTCCHKNVNFIFISFGKFSIKNLKQYFTWSIPGSDVSIRSFLVPGREVLLMATLSAASFICSTAGGQRGDLRPFLMLWLVETSGQKLHHYLHNLQQPERQNCSISQAGWVTTGCSYCLWLVLVITSVPCLVFTTEPGSENTPVTAHPPLPPHWSKPKTNG